MRTFICKKLQSVLRWLQLWLICHKTVMNTRKAVLYLKTDMVNIYRLKQNYFLPSSKTSSGMLFFKEQKLMKPFGIAALNRLDGLFEAICWLKPTACPDKNREQRIQLRISIIDSRIGIKVLNHLNLIPWKN